LTEWETKCRTGTKGRRSVKRELDEDVRGQLQKARVLLAFPVTHIGLKASSEAFRK